MRNLPTLARRPAGALVAVLAAVLALGAVDAHAQWKWRDSTGRITVSDLPPPRDVPERDILQRPAAPTVVAAPTPPASAPAAAAATASRPAVTAGQTPQAGVDPELDARRKAAEQEQAERRRAEQAQRAEQRAANCRAARSNLAALQSGQRMVRMNDKGEREFLDDKQRAAEIQRARQVIASDCN